MGNDNNINTDSLRKGIEAEIDRIKEMTRSANDSVASLGPAKDMHEEGEDPNGPPDSDLLKRKKGKQNLKHREELINRLLRLFAVQMVCMNIIIAFVIFASYVKLSWLRDMSDSMLSTLTRFMTFYITAVLAELLAAIVYIVKKVFSE